MKFNLQLRAAERMEKKGYITDVRTVVDDPRAIMGMDFIVTPKGYAKAKRVYASLTIEEQILVRAYLAELEKQQGNMAH